MWQTGVEWKGIVGRTSVRQQTAKPNLSGYPAWILALLGENLAHRSGVDLVNLAESVVPVMAYAGVNPTANLDTEPARLL
jgi:hypothetical protein